MSIFTRFDPMGRRLKRYYAGQLHDARRQQAQKQLRIRLAESQSAVRVLTPPTVSPHHSRRALIFIPLLVLAMTGTAFALRGMINLGPATNAVPQYIPLGQFFHLKSTLRKFDRVEMLFIGSQNDNVSAAERWPIVKALNLFGHFSDLHSLYPVDHRELGLIPTFDFTHATYRSQYVYFDHRELYGPHAVTWLFNRNVTRLISHAQMLQRLTPEEARALRTYGKIGFPNDYYPVTIANTAQKRYNLRLRTGTPPMELVGDYVMNGGYISGDEMMQAGPQKVLGEPGELSFNDVQRALQAGYEKQYVPYVYDIDAETNIITALICHADGMQPEKVCGRKVVQHLLRHVR